MKNTKLGKCATIILIALLFFSSGWAAAPGALAQAGTWHIATDGSDVSGDGSEAAPFATIQHGIDMAGDGDTVLVHPGTYQENINFGGKNITVGSLFVTTGDKSYVSNTVIDGNRNGHVVMFGSGEGNAAKLSGFTITNGYARADLGSDSGGGIWCDSSNLTLTDLRVTGNEAGAEGGGLFLAHCSPAIRDVAITNNTAGGGGGGVRYSYGSVDLENIVVTGNLAQTGGSGVFLYHADGMINNALIADNSGGGKGGGLVFDGSSPTFVNVTIVGNQTTDHGGGLNVSYMSQPTLVNAIVWGNTPEEICFDPDWPGEATSIEYSDIQGGEAGIVTNGQGPVNWGAGNLDADPAFVDAGLGDYHLRDSSPCLGTGKAEGAPSTDVEGNPHPAPSWSQPDMGAYESAYSGPAELQVTRGPDLRVPRMGHTATPLADGCVLLVGGSTDVDVFLVDADLFDPATGQTSQVAPLHTARHAHMATLLGDGRVLVMGGYAWGWLNDAEVYDPVTDRWTVIPPIYSHSLSASVTLMQDGRVLVVGGCIGSGQFTDRVEILDPQTNAWTEVQPLPAVRAGHTAQLLDDGRVLVIGGQTDANGVVGGDALLYDPQADTWTATGPMVDARLAAQSVRLGDGRVLAAGGMRLVDMPTTKLTASAEIYDPAADTWTAVPAMSQPRYSHFLALLPSGLVLAVGGARDPDGCWTDDSFVQGIELYDPAANQWRTAAELPQPRADAAAALLADGRVWLTGGRTHTSFLADSWWLIEGEMIAGFTADPSSGLSPLAVQFTNESTGDYDTCAWDFGDGGTSSDCNNPVHTYTTAGVYSVALMVSGPGGTDTYTRSDYVTVWIAPNLTTAVQASSDDAHEVKATGAVNVGASVLHMTYNDKRIVGLRFRNIPIPPGATITAASLNLTAYGSDSAATLLTIQGQADDNAMTFTTAVRDLSKRATTVASVGWDVPAWTENSTYQSPDLAAIIQEIVDRPGWAQNNALVMIISGTGQRRAFAYNGAAAKAAKLAVTYSAPCYSLTTAVEPAGAGTVTTTPAPTCGGSNYVVGTTVQLTAEPSAGYSFRSWGGDVTGSANTASVIMDADKTVTANMAEGYDVRLVVGSNDAHEIKATGLVNLGAVALNMTYNDKRIVGLRFQGVPLPQGATVTGAYVEFTAYADDSAAAALVIEGQAANNPPTFTTVARNLSMRNRTAAAVAWTPTAWVASSTYRSPDLSAVVQEIVNRAG